jgi:hypothetical protein
MNTTTEAATEAATRQKSFVSAEKAVEAYRAHQGGGWFGWLRLMRRNRYTVDPAEPIPDDLDKEKQRLHAAAVKAVADFAACEGVYPSDVAYSFGGRYMAHPPGWAE